MVAASLIFKFNYAKLAIVIFGMCTSVGIKYKLASVTSRTRIYLTGSHHVTFLSREMFDVTTRVRNKIHQNQHITPEIKATTVLLKANKQRHRGLMDLFSM